MGGARGLAVERDLRASEISEMLDELAARVELARNKLGTLFEEHKRYLNEVLGNLINSDLTSKLDKSAQAELLEFKEVSVKLLEKAFPQAKERLEKLKRTLSRGEVAVRSFHGKRTLHIVPRDERWFVLAAHRGTWVFQLPIHGVGATVHFPDFMLPRGALELLQAGWRASDEGTHYRSASMGTTRIDQLLAWLLTRPGVLHIRIAKLLLNKRGPSLAWYAYSSWVQRWSKDEARALAFSNALALLTLYLGDGRRHPSELQIVVGRKPIYMPKRKVQEIVDNAYVCQYGELLDLVRCEKWLTLKRILPKRDPVCVLFDSQHVHARFRFKYSKRMRYFRADAHFKSEEEAKRCAEELAKLGVYASVYRVSQRGYQYWIVTLGASEIAKLARTRAEWRHALEKFLEKKGLQNLLVTRELAESPPLPQNFQPSYPAAPPRTTP